MILQPLGTRVLLKRISIRSFGSIIVPKTSRQAEICLGEVKAIGPDCEILNVGDTCLFGQYAPLKIDTRDMEFIGIKLDKEEYEDLHLMNEEDALCIIKDETWMEKGTRLSSEYLEKGASFVKKLEHVKHSNTFKEA